jgi:hypothetical protein
MAALRRDGYAADAQPPCVALLVEDHDFLTIRWHRPKPLAAAPSPWYLSAMGRERVLDELEMQWQEEAMGIEMCTGAIFKGAVV